MKAALLFTTLVTFAMVAGGCAGTRWVRRTPTGGTIALRGDYDSAMSDARRQMSRHCGGPYSIVEEGEVVIGETTTGVANTRGGRRSTITVGTTHSEQETEWRVTYACGIRTIQAAAPPAPPAVPAE